MELIDTLRINGVSQIAEKGDIFMLYPTGTVGIHFRNQQACVGFIPIDQEGKPGKPLIAKNLIGDISTDSTVKTNIIKVNQTILDNFYVENKKFNDSMNYKPGFLGMDNFFFFPKGYLAMDEILAKFGLSVNAKNNNAPDTA